MLKNSVLTEFIEKQFNTINTNEYYKFRIFNSAGDYEQKSAGANISGVLHNIADGSVRTEMDYMITTCSYELSLALSVTAGLGEIKEIEEIVNHIVIGLNNKPFDIDGGKLLMSFRPQKSGGYASRDRVGRSVEIKISFSIEYSEILTNGNYFEMALIDNPFDNSTVNTRYFTSQTEQVEWYNNKIANGGIPYAKTFTPNVNSLTITNQVYINSANLNISDILMKNYAIIREKDKDGNILNHYYYWVENASLGANNQPLLNLRMDTLQTIYFNPNLQIPQSLIKRGHLNRWIDNGDGTVTFDCTPNSKLFETEGRDTPKRLTRRTKAQLKHTGNTEVDAWLDENVAYWVCAYVNQFHTYMIKLRNDSYPNGGDAQLNSYYDILLRNNGVGGSSFDNEVGIVFYPVMKRNNVFFRYTIGNNVRNVIMGIRGMQAFRELNSNTSYIYGLKLTQKCPIGTTGLSFTIENNNLYITSSIPTLDDTIYPCGNTKVAITELHGDVSTSIDDGLFVSLADSTNLSTYNYNTNNQYTFNKTSLIGATRSMTTNPKLLSQDFTELNVVDSTGNSFTYDKQKIGQNTVSFLYTEPITPEITRSYFRLKAPVGLYVDDTDNNYMGLVSSIDNSLPIANDAYSSFLASNKNFHMQNALSYIQGAVGSGISIGKSIGSSVMKGDLVGAAVGGVTETISAGVNLGFSVAQKQLSIDNMKNAPGSVKNANGNPLFNMYINNISMFVEEYDAMDNDKKQLDDVMYLNGFAYDRLDNVRDYDNIRHYFNYVQANIESFGGVSMSNQIRDDLKIRFANGVRFWNQDNIDYTMENYEKWLNNE